MRIALFSDVHANLPALEAVLKDIDAQRPDMIFCLGDLVNQNVWNNEVVELVRSRSITTIKGNHDLGIALGQHLFPFSYTFPDARKWGIEAIAYTLDRIKPDNQRYLHDLPNQIRMDLGLQPENISLLMVHGSPRDIHEYIFRATPDDKVQAIMEEAEAHILLMGHTHRPFHHIFSSEPDGKKRVAYRHAINVGSAGRPKDGDWHPCYTLLTINRHKSLLYDPDAIQVDFIKVDYDLEKAVKSIKNSVLPVYYGSCLLTGGG